MTISYDGFFDGSITIITIITVTYYVPENTFDGLFAIHDAYYEIHQYDLSGHLNGRFISTAENGTVSVWEYAGRKFDEAYSNLG